MKSMTLVISLVLVAHVAYGAEAPATVKEISWSELEGDGKLLTGRLLPTGQGAPFEQLEVSNPGDDQFTATLVTIEAPGVGRPAYAVIGQVRYENVAGTGYLEMWSHFPDGSMVFSRTLGDSGPLGSLRGSSGWRDFSLPLYLQASPARPTKLVVNVALPGRGSVFLSPLRLIQYSGNGPVPPGGQFWGELRWRILGGALGAAVGVVITVVGVLASKGRARKAVMLVLKGTILSGVVMLTLGALAVVAGRPYPVSFLLILAGVLAVLVPAVSLPRIRKRYEALEMRRMEALDAR
jgi:hypothetical protein